MLKPDSLRAALTLALPDLVLNPDRLAIFVEEGHLAARMSAAPNFPQGSFEYRYKLNVVLLGLSGAAEHPDVVMIAVLLWLHDHQPDLLQRADKPPVTFKADVVDGNATDLLLELQLSETVRVAPRPGNADGSGGGFDILHLPEPPVIGEFEGVPRWTPLRQIYVDGQLVVDADAAPST